MNPSRISKLTFLAIFILATTLMLNAQSPYKLGTHFDIGTGRVAISDVVTDSLHNRFVVGFASANTTFSLAQPVVVTGGGSPVFVAKIDSTGQMQWVKYWTSYDRQDVNSIALSPSGEVLVGGYLTDSIVSSNILELNGYPVSGIMNNYVLKLDGNGTFQWMNTFEDPKIVLNVSSFGDLVVGSGGDVYATGSFAGMVDFDPGPDTLYKAAVAAPVSVQDPTDIFILKLDANGDLKWVRQVVGGHTDYGLAIALDSQENLLIGGVFQDTVDFNVGGHNGVVGEPLLSGVLPIGQAFIAKYDSAGNFHWVRDYGGFHKDMVWSIELDASDNIYVAGEYSDSADMDPGPAVAYTAAMGRDGFVQKLDSSGNLIWLKRFGGAHSGDKMTDIAVSSTGRVLTTGSFVDSVALNPDSSNYSKGDLSLFSVTGLIELESDGTFRWAQPLADNSATGWGVGYTSNNSPYIFGRFYDTLDIEPRASISYEIYSGASTKGFFYELQACPGVQTRISDTACGSFDFHDSSYVKSGVYTYPLLTTSRCDSIVVLNLSIDKIQDGIGFKDSLTLEAIDTSASYVWYNCTEGVYLPDDTLQQFKPTDNDQYAVLLKKGVCEVLSSCISLSEISNPEYDNPVFQLFPNPVDDYLVISRQDREDNDFSVEVYTANGILVKRFGEQISSEKVVLDFREIPTGIYLVNIMDGGSQKYFKVIKE